jgi:hypothetical protein
VLPLLFCALPLYAQEQSGSIQGVVKDTSGAVLPGVTVEARSPALVGVSTAVSDGEGAYRFPALPPGMYELTAKLQGFTDKKLSDVALTLGQTLKIEFVMAVSGISETVQISAESPVIDVKQNAAAQTISADIIDRIPKGRDWTSVVTTAPGANNESRAGGLQIDGSSGSENRFIVDGMDRTNLRTGTSDAQNTTNSTVLTDFLQEVQVKSSGYAAEYGGSTGGVISAITKSGSNQFRGSAGTYYQLESGRRYRRSDLPEQMVVLFRRQLQPDRQRTDDDVQELAAALRHENDDELERLEVLRVERDVAAHYGYAASRQRRQHTRCESWVTADDNW